MFSIPKIENYNLFEGYERDGSPKPITRFGQHFDVQYYKGEHEDEYTLINEKEIRHYENGILLGIWKVTDGEISGSFEVFEGGCALYRQDWDSRENASCVRTVNKKSVCVKEIVDKDTGTTIYRGGLDKDGKRIGRGFEFDRQTGAPVLEGEWINDSLVRIIRSFEGDTMTEFMDIGNSTDVYSQVPIYVGGYEYNDYHCTCTRNGKGYLINIEGRASCEGTWTKGIVEQSTLLTNGWYQMEEDPLHLPIDCTEINVPAEKLKFEHFLDLSKYKKATKIMIGSYNFCNTDHFSLSENNCLEELEIRDHSFYRIDPANRMNRTFSLVDCANLRSIIIGSFSFQFFSGEFELSRLPSLELLKIGVINDSSANFNHCNFILKGKRFVRRFIHRSEEIENHRAGRSRV